MPEYQLPISNLAQWQNVSEFVQGYIEAAFFTECNPDNPELEHAETGDIAPEAWNKAVADCRAFQHGMPRDHHNRTPLDLAYDYSPADYTAAQAGRDFWFTRNGHGVGFWDRKLGEIGDTLSELARKAGGSCLYRGDDGKVYFG